jgi:hypothetical protein
VQIYLRFRLQFPSTNAYQKDLRNVVSVINALSSSIINRMILDVPFVDVTDQARVRIREHNAKEN